MKFLFKIWSNYDNFTPAAIPQRREPDGTVKLYWLRYIESVGMDAIVSYERELGERFLAGLPESCELHGLPTMDGRVPTFAFNVRGLTPAEAATRLGERGYAVWHGNYYAVEVMKRLGLPDGAVRAGIVHYNTADEVDGLLVELAAL